MNVLSNCKNFRNKPLNIRFCQFVKPQLASTFTYLKSQIAQYDLFKFVGLSVYVSVVPYKSN